MGKAKTTNGRKKTLRNYSDVLTVPEVAEIFGCSTKTIYRMAKNKTIASFKFGRKLRFKKEVLLNYIDQCAQNSDDTPV